MRRALIAAGLAVALVGAGFGEAIGQPGAAPKSPASKYKVCQIGRGSLGHGAASLNSPEITAAIAQKLRAGCAMGNLLVLHGFDAEDAMLMLCDLRYQPVVSGSTLMCIWTGVIAEDTFL